MLAYRVRDFGLDNSNNTRYFFFKINRPVDGDVTDMTDVLLLRSDYRFAFYQDQPYRVCEVELEDPDGFVKVWQNDPFKDFPDYEPLPVPLNGRPIARRWMGA